MEDSDDNVKSIIIYERRLLYHNLCEPRDVFGHIPGIPVGSTFDSRQSLHDSSVHTGIRGGIYGRKDAGCYSIVMNGGYEDDLDQGYRFIYAGSGGHVLQGGEWSRKGPQKSDQSWSNPRNASLRLSSYTKNPVRVVRGYESSSDFAPAKGYRYDGLYVVEEAWMEAGKSGYQVCLFLLQRLEGQPPIPRRQGTLNLELSEWDRPRLSSKSRSSSQTSAAERLHQSLEQLHLSDGDTLDVAHRQGNDRAPAKDQPGPVAGPSGTQPPIRKHTSNLPAVEPILPTTNVASSRLRPPVVAQAQAAAPEPDVFALLKEWGSTPSKRA